MASVVEFKEQVRHLGELVNSFERMPDTPHKAACKELMQLLMELQSQGLERMMEIIFECGDSGGALIDRLAEDDISGGLLLLYSLHPDALETRVHTAIERVRPRLRKLSCTVDLISIEGDNVRVRVTAGGHSCGSSANDLRSIVENGVFELAPEVKSLEIVGLDVSSSTGFVALDSLIGRTPAKAEDERGQPVGSAG